MNIESIKEAVGPGGQRGANALVDFASAYAINPKLKHEALILKARYMDTVSQKSALISCKKCWSWWTEYLTITNHLSG
jgi:hypothetical protein